MFCKEARTVLFVLLFSFNLSYAKKSDVDLKIQNIFNAHVEKYKEMEYFSGASLSYYIPKKPIHNFYVGQITHDENSAAVSEDTLFQIGSITKSFTGALILQLEKADKLNLHQTLQEWLPEYSKWGRVSIETLLNMTSGLPNYSDTPLWNAAEFNQPEKIWNNKNLIGFVYPIDHFNPPLKTGFFYSNTGYVLADMIIEKATNTAFADMLQTQLIEPAKLTNTFYPVPQMPNAIKSRLAHGYNYNQYDNPANVGRDLNNNNLSWAAAAGGLVSNTEDVIKWVKALFVDHEILDAKQKQKLMRLVSMPEGKFISTVSEKNPRGFGLGVSASFKPLGKIWYYEGETLGFRALYIYKPCNGMIISTAFNSATNEENDHAKDLIIAVYNALIEQYPGMRC